MKILKLLVLEGDGIGPEITQSTIEILEETLKKTRIKFELIYDMVGV